MRTELGAVKLDLLHTFHQIASHQSLKRAAKSLHLSPPAVTHALARLEAQLGRSLCVRGKAGFRLTDAGRRLFASTREIFGELGRTLAELGEGAPFRGVLGIGVLHDLVDPRIDRALGKLLRGSPEVRLHLRAADPEGLSRGVWSGELQLAIGIFWKRIDALAYRRVAAQKLQYFVSDGHPLWRRRRVTRADLAGQRVAWIEAGSRDAFELETEVFGAHPRYQMTVGAHANSLQGGLRILLAGNAVVPLPEHWVRALPAGVRRRIRRLPAQTSAPSLPIEAVWDPRVAQVTPVRELLDSLTLG